ncbi:MAG: cupin domain-containing protein [Clostridiales bacterium]|nr:cupin domain-containing protein [Clostridiales bacterium]
MVINNSDDKFMEVREQMRGGEGKVMLEHFLQGKKLPANVRMAALLTLENGSSIGYHVHDRESEIYYVITGEISYSEKPDGSEAVTLERGDFTCAGHGGGHTVKGVSEKPAQFLAIVVTE